MVKSFSSNESTTKVVRAVKKQDSETGAAQILECLRNSTHKETHKRASYVYPVLSCKFCSFRGRLNHLKRHVLFKHTDKVDWPYHCMPCGRHFATLYCFQGHKKTKKHGKNMKKMKCNYTEMGCC